MQEPSKSCQRGESDRANVLVMIFGFVIMLAVLWTADKLFTSPADEGVRTTASAGPVGKR